MTDTDNRINRILNLCFATTYRPLADAEVAHLREFVQDTAKLVCYAKNIDMAESVNRACKRIPNAWAVELIAKARKVEGE